MSAMFIPAPAENRDEGEDDERQGDKREQDVGDEHRKIKPGDESVVAGGFFAGVRHDK